MNGHNLTVGNMGENMAVDYLTKKGYIIISRNFRTPYGEIDIIAAKGDTTVFCEVKTRSTDRYGLGREAITPAKLKHMLNSADHYCREHNIENSPVRLDVVEITLNNGSIVHFKDITS